MPGCLTGSEERFRVLERVPLMFWGLDEATKSRHKNFSLNESCKLDYLRNQTKCLGWRTLEENSRNSESSCARDAQAQQEPGIENHLFQTVLMTFDIDSTTQFQFDYFPWRQSSLHFMLEFFALRFPLYKEKLLGFFLWLKQRLCGSELRKSQVRTPWLSLPCEGMRACRCSHPREIPYGLILLSWSNAEDPTQSDWKGFDGDRLRSWEKRSRWWPLSRRNRRFGFWLKLTIAFGFYLNRSRCANGEGIGWY